MWPIASSVSRSVESDLSWLAREPSGTPSRYLSVSIPWASGENAMQPAPTSVSVSSRPSVSTQRLSIEYDGWWISSGVPRSPRIRAASRVSSGEYDEIPTYSALPERTMASSAPIVSSSGVEGSGRWW